MHEAIEVLGILAFISLILAATTGLMIFKFHVKQVKMKWHILFATSALIFALLHVVLIILY